MSVYDNIRDNVPGRVGPYVEMRNIAGEEVTPAQVSEFKAKLGALILALEHHPQMSHTNPAASPKQLYHTWDFVNRTLYNLSQIPAADLAANNEDALETYSDCLCRCWMADTIITDRSFRTVAMFGAGQLVDFGPEVKAKSKECKEWAGLGKNEDDEGKA